MSLAAAPPTRSLPPSRRRSRRSSRADESYSTRRSSASRRRFLPEARLAGLGLMLVGLLIGPSPAEAISFSTFGPFGTGGTLAGQSFTVGPDAEVFELEAILGHAGTPSGARLSSEAVPAGLSISFAASLSPDASDLSLVYSISNTGVTALDDVFFVSYLDAEIAEPTNTFFNEFVTTSGSLAPGQQFEVDEPGFAGVGDVFDNAVAGVLDGTNALADATSADDVAMAIGWSLGRLEPGQLQTIELMISEDGDSIGGFSLTQADTGPLASPTTLTLSGRRATIGNPIPEPGAALLYAVGLAVASGLRRRIDRPVTITRS